LSVGDRWAEGAVNIMNIELLTFLQVVIGPLLLAAALAYGIVKYRQRGLTTKQLTEEATRDLYREGDEQERQQESPPLSPAEAGQQARDHESWKERLRP
jgi:hypothetical protein